MKIEKRPTRGRILRVVLIGAATKIAITAAAYFLAMNMLNSPIS